VSKKAIAHLSLDPRFKTLIDETKLRKQTRDGDVYANLIRAIVYQQLSGKAAGTIHGRFLDLFKDQYPNAKKLVRMDVEQLRAVGLSYQKANYIKNVAQFWLDQRLKSMDWKKLSDDEAVELLTQIKGVGVWSAQMILMFTLKRPDVFPIGDLGIRNAIIKKYRLRSSGKALEKRILKIAEPWRPYRTLACVFLWSWLDS